MANTENETNYKAICCEQIPELFLDKLTAKNHFSRFGTINRFILRPSRLSCTVEYETEQEAEQALLEAGEYNGMNFIVTYADREVAHIRNTEEWVNPDVQSELEAMNPELSRAAVRGKYSSQNENVFKSPSPVDAKLFHSPIKTRASLPPAFEAPPALVPKVTTASKSSSELPKVDPSLRGVFENVMRMQALTADQKYNVLDSRDKLVRLFTVHETDITKAVSIKGFCPDMCPEKERWLRSWRGQAAYYECETVVLPLSSMNVSPHLAIKQYSRSSADQEVPLPHELRPEGVLTMTMQYMLKYIMDLCNDPSTSLEAWFHFVWDRTRSIRKDITQQELCSLGAVNLVEQCARFHIHCAARLVAEGPRVFDKKINAENLTKCLQTLKYMYHDLRLKGTRCPHEAEFRSYIVMLNLGDSNFIWELKQLPEDIQQSTEVKRALQFYNALQNNNFVRFFNMVRSSETSYLSACILLGYFNKLRIKAMEAIIKAYNWRKNTVFLPLDYLTSILAFENVDATRSFLIYHGLEGDDEDRVMLKRLMKPEVEYSMRRAVTLVESKLRSTIGECVCGGPLDATGMFENHVPHNSFDDRGYLKSEAWSAYDQLRGQEANIKKLEFEAKAESRDKSDASIFKVPNVLPTSVRQPQTQQQQQQMPQPNIFDNLQTQQQQPLFKLPTQTTGTHIFGSGTAFTSSGNIFGNVAPTTSTASQSNIFAKAAVASTGGIFAAAAADKHVCLFSSVGNKDESEMFRNVVAQAKESVRSEAGKDRSFEENEAEQPFFYFTRQRERDIHQQGHDKAKREAAEQAKQLAEEEERRLRQLEIEAQRKQKEKQKEKEQQTRLKEEKIQKMTVQAEKISKELIDEVLSQQIYYCAYTELSRLQNLDAKSLKELDALLTEMIGKETADIAKQEIASATLKRMLMMKIFRRWHVYAKKKRRQRNVLNEAPVWIHTETREENAKQLKHPHEEENLSMIKRYRYGEPCDFKKLLSHTICGFTRNNLNIPHLVSKYKLQSTERYLPGPLKYFKFVFSLPAECEELRGFDSLCSKWLKKHVNVPKSQKPDTPCFICAQEHGAAVCVRKITGISAVNEDKQPVKLECSHADAIICFMSCVDVKNTQRRLANILRLTNNSRAIPVAFVVYNSKNSEWELRKELGLDNSKISECAFFGCEETKRQFNFTNNLRSALRFTIQNSKHFNKAKDELEGRKLQPWLEDNLGEEMWMRWSYSYKGNVAFATICKKAEHVVGIYNEAVKRLLKIATEDVQHMPEFPMELREFVPAIPEDVEIPLGLEHFPKDWKNPARQNELRKLLKKLMLPKIEKTPALTADLVDVQKWLLNFGSSCVDDEESIFLEITHRAITLLVQQLNAKSLLDLPLEARLARVNFLPIIQIFASAQFNWVLKNYVTCICPQEVIYKRKDLLDYHEVPWWLNYKAIEDVVLDGSLLEAHHKARLEAKAAIEKQNQEVAELVARAQAIEERAITGQYAVKQSTMTLKKSIRKKERDLDRSLNEYELAKRCGEFDYTYIEKIADDMDEEFEGAIGGATEGESIVKEYGQKRKLEIEDDADDFSAVIAKSRKLLERIQERKVKEKKFF